MEEKCVACDNEALGQCENCDAPICEDHCSSEFDDVLVCLDEEACEERIDAAE